MWETNGTKEQPCDTEMVEVGFLDYLSPPEDLREKKLYQCPSCKTVLINYE